MAWMGAKGKDQSITERSGREQRSGGMGRQTARIKDARIKDEGEG
jgi:hypothetical protein